jgi:hypothetical protein
MYRWQKIDRKTLTQIKDHYLKFDPYCHFNMVDLWSYHTNVNHWFKVGDTAIYRLNDYMDDSLYLTILGEDSIQEAIRELCKKSKTEQIILKRVPEPIVEKLNNWDALISSSEDHDNHDYIFKVDSLVNFSSRELRHKYRLYLKLIKHKPGLYVRPLDNTKPYDRSLIYKMFRTWVSQTGSYDWQKEFRALTRALNLKGANLVCLGFFDGSKIVGYTINEPESNDYYQAYFGKADRNYRGLTLLQEHETAKYMQNHFGSKYMNLQPDCGLEGLRQYKTSLGPLKKLKKYIIVIDREKALV